MTPLKRISPTNSPSAQAALQQLTDLLATGGVAALDQRIKELSGDHTGLWLSRFVTQDPVCNDIKSKVRRLSTLDDTVLITGPSGVGKELLANALHGMRPPKRFFTLNCAAMPADLIESELFGHRSGAFTGAKYDNLGILRAAEGGTVFLDEIGESPAHLQAKLLRVLQPAPDGKRYVRPVGDTEQYPVNFRLVCATRRDLRRMLIDGTFREDLYGRLMTFELNVPPLSARVLDIPLLLQHFGYVGDDIMDKYADDPLFKHDVDLFNVRAITAYVRRSQVFPHTTGNDND